MPAPSATRGHPQPLRFWDGDHLVAEHDRRIRHRSGGQWTSLSYTSDSEPFHDAQAHCLLRSPQKSGAVRFRPWIPAAGRPLPGTALAPDELTDLVLAPASSVALFLHAPTGPSRDPARVRAGHRTKGQPGSAQSGTAAGAPTAVVTPDGLREAVRSLLGEDRLASASFHRPAGRLYVRRSSHLGVSTFVWVLSCARTSPR
ncbi:hypothetical protein ACIOG4_27725 [Streptomyces microflavus]|uniref:hypothetical protein n=1 Tax=Streptomyces microflavus TaxID=1919 RepID=UPI00381EAA2F